MLGIHYSRAVRTSLDSGHYGTGNPCAARHRVAGHAVLAHRIHFYVERDGVRHGAIVPERACGPHRHTADLSGVYIYDMAEDVLHLRQKAHNMNPTNQAERVNALELSVVTAGFDGYRAPFGQCDAVVLLGERSVSVTHTPDA